MKGFIAALVLALSMQQTPQELLNQLQATHDQEQVIIDQLRAAMVPTVPPPPPPISTPEAFSARMAGAVQGDVIPLDPTLVVTNAVTLNVGVTLMRPGLAGVRMDKDTTPLPKFMNGITVAADNVTIQGVEAHIVYYLGTIIDVKYGTKNLTLDQNRIIGTDAVGARRGIAGNAANIVVTRNYVGNIWTPYPSSDSQAFCAWNTPGPGLLEDNYFEGSTESVMFGGADPSSVDNVPSDFVIRLNTITKNPAWQFLPVSVKNILELKNARRFTIENNDISQSWGGRGQTGYAIVFTVRNQSNTAPYSTVEDIVFRNNNVAHAAAALNLLGHDSPNVSQVEYRISVLNNVFDDMDPVKYTGDNKMIILQAGPQVVTIDGNTFRGRNIGSWLYFSGGTLSADINVTNNTVPPSLYYVFSSFGTVGDLGAKTWAHYVTSGVLGPNVVQ